jgi:hypothetical protein
VEKEEEECVMADHFEGMFTMDAVFIFKNPFFCTYACWHTMSVVENLNGVTQKYRQVAGLVLVQ